jgi:hypothetical protein
MSYYQQYVMREKREREGGGLDSKTRAGAEWSNESESKMVGQNLMTISFIN